MPAPRRRHLSPRSSGALLAALAGLAVLAAGCGAPSLASAQATSPGAELAAAARRPGPGWLEGAVIYGIVPPLCGEEPLRDTTRKLAYLAEQGVDAVWLSPVNETDDQSAISYAVTDYRAVRKDFGTREDFKALVAEAHRRGLKVLMDFVPNHTSTGHPFFQDAEKHGRKSPYWRYYVRDAQGQPQHYFDWTSLINLNYDHAPVQAHLTDAFTFWATEMGVDGFRVDAAWGIKDRTPSYWPKLAQSLRSQKPDVFLLAEASARDPYYVRSGFDAAYDWSKELGHWSWEHVWQDPARAGEQLHRALAGRETPPERIARFINNNDTGKRFITAHGPAAQRVAAVLMHTLPGIPVVYMGDEVGAEFEPYEDPPPISWTDKHRLRPLYKRLAELRGSLPALKTGSWKPLETPQAPGVYAFVREAGPREWAVVVLNFGAATTIDLTVPATIAPAAAHLTDALTARPFKLRAASGATWSVAAPKQRAFVLTASPSLAPP